MNPLVLVSANAEWRVVKELLSPTPVETTPLGETFVLTMDARQVRFFHGGWGKISAAATAQYALDRWQPDLLVNLGTCGGFAGRIERGTLLLVERTIVYDILEQMGDAAEAIAHYSTTIDLAWLGDRLPHAVRRGLLVSADRDIVKEQIPMLIEEYDAIAADWESGAIAWVTARAGVRCLILRGVTDLVDPQGGEAYGNIAIFHDNTRRVMDVLLRHLPDWLALADASPR
jgi:adenosylhomocysteine nucleosidase